MAYQAPRPRKPQKAPRRPKLPADSAKKAKQIIQRRTIYLLLLFGVVTFLAVFAKAYDLTMNQGDEQTRSTTITASRGTIYDRNGTILAISAMADTVFLDPKVIQEYAAELDVKRAEALAKGVKSGETLPMTGQEYKDLIASKLAQLLGLQERDV